MFAQHLSFVCPTAIKYRQVGTIHSNYGGIPDIVKNSVTKPLSILIKYKTMVTPKII
jgi:hypothetical protein